MMKHNVLVPGDLVRWRQSYFPSDDVGIVIEVIHVEAQPEPVRIMWSKIQKVTRSSWSSLVRLT